MGLYDGYADSEPPGPSAVPEHLRWDEIFVGDRNVPSVFRMRVPSGWLYMIAGKGGAAFVPDA